MDTRDLDLNERMSLHEQLRLLGAKEMISAEIYLVCFHESKCRIPVVIVQTTDEVKLSLGNSF